MSWNMNEIKLKGFIAISIKARQKETRKKDERELKCLLKSNDKLRQMIQTKSFGRSHI